VEYTVPDEDNPGEWKMKEAASSCKISVITRMQKYSTGSRFVTSIWTVTDDRRVRLQQKRKLFLFGRTLWIDRW
jgi:hypothetical protein